LKREVVNAVVTVTDSASHFLIQHAAIQVKNQLRGLTYDRMSQSFTHLRNSVSNLRMKMQSSILSPKHLRWVYFRIYKECNVIFDAESVIIHDLASIDFFLPPKGFHYRLSTAILRQIASAHGRSGPGTGFPSRHRAKKERNRPPFPGVSASRNKAGSSVGRQMLLSGVGHKSGN
jgi:hypothetical protein